MCHLNLSFSEGGDDSGECPYTLAKHIGCGRCEKGIRTVEEPTRKEERKEEMGASAGIPGGSHTICTNHRGVSPLQACVIVTQQPRPVSSSSSASLLRARDDVWEPLCILIEAPWIVGDE